MRGQKVNQTRHWIRIHNNHTRVIERIKAIQQVGSERLVVVQPFFNTG